MRCLRKPAAERPTMAEICDALEQARGWRPRGWLRWLLWTAVLLAIAATAALVILAER
jgi:hypothetical protein